MPWDPALKYKGRNVRSLTPGLENFDANDELYDQAGITKEERAQLLRDAFDKVREKLTAKTAKTFQYMGEIIQSEPVDDHAIQLEAAREAIDLAGVTKKQAPRVMLRANVNLPDWAEGKSEAQVRIIEETSHGPATVANLPAVSRREERDGAYPRSADSERSGDDGTAPRSGA